MIAQQTHHMLIRKSLVPSSYYIKITMSSFINFPSVFKRRTYHRVIVSLFVYFFQTVEIHKKLPLDPVVVVYCTKTIVTLYLTKVKSYIFGF